MKETKELLKVATLRGEVYSTYLQFCADNNAIPQTKVFTSIHACKNIQALNICMRRVQEVDIYLFRATVKTPRPKTHRLLNYFMKPLMGADNCCHNAIGFSIIAVSLLLLSLIYSYLH